MRGGEGKGAAGTRRSDAGKEAKYGQLREKWNIKREQ